MTTITVTTTVNATAEKVWKLWTTAEDIMQWNQPNDAWHTTTATVDLVEQGAFLLRMETKDGAMGFDHAGKYDKLVPHHLMEYTGNDGRKSVIQFTAQGDQTLITEIFVPDKEPSLEIQQDFCQGVLNSFKQYAENKI